MHRDLNLDTHPRDLSGVHTRDLGNIHPRDIGNIHPRELGGIPRELGVGGGPSSHRDLGGHRDAELVQRDMGALHRDMGTLHRDMHREVVHEIRVQEVEPRILTPPLPSTQAPG